MPQDVENRPSKPPPPASWSSLPHKGQLAIICSIRMVDFFQQASLQAYMFYQLKSFSPQLDDGEISFQAGVLQGVFTAAQIFTGILWGRVADQPWCGRKTVLLIGLTGQGLSCVGVAFSRSFLTAVIWRCLGGAVNATVGGARTALAETTEKKYHSRTFLLLPLAFNIANIFGPILGGMLSDPVQHYPSLFGSNSAFGGSNGVGWLQRYPYAAPNLLAAVILFADAALVFLGLRETLAARRFTRDRGIEMAEQIRYYFSRTLFNRFGYTQVDQQGPDSMEDDEVMETSTPLTPLPHKEQSGVSSKPLPEPIAPRAAPPFYHALTSNVLLVMATVALMDFQMGGFASLWTIFLSSARRTDAEKEDIHLPFSFTGGLGFTPQAVGFAMSILGIIGIILQITLYPSINAKYGLLKSTRVSLFVFPIAYFLAPYLSLLSGEAATLWLGIALVLLLQVGARTFTLPGTILLINNSSPAPQLLGTIHGMGAATSSAFRTVGPIVAGHWYAQGLREGMVGVGWWGLALISILGCIPPLWVRDGH